MYRVAGIGHIQPRRLDKAKFETYYFNALLIYCRACFGESANKSIHQVFLVKNPSIKFTTSVIIKLIQNKD